MTEKETRPKNIPHVMIFHAPRLFDHYEKIIDMQIKQMTELVSMMFDLSKDDPVKMIEFLIKIKKKIATVADSLKV